MKSKSKQKETDPNSNSFNLPLPGLSHELNICFPHRQLPSCVKCKGQFKSRPLCRVKKNHKSLPWCATFICVTLDESCIDEENNCAVDGPYEISKPSSEWRPYLIKNPPEAHTLWAHKNNDEYGTKKSTSTKCNQTEKKDEASEVLPMCTECKIKNYTGAYCRSRRVPHRYLPWNTIYVDMSVPKNEKNSTTDPTLDNELKTTAKRKKSKNQNESLYANESVPGSRFFEQLDESRTFFVKVSAKYCEIQWVDFDEVKDSRSTQSGGHQLESTSTLTSTPLPPLSNQTPVKMSNDVSADSLPDYAYESAPSYYPNYYPGYYDTNPYSRVYSPHTFHTHHETYDPSNPYATHVHPYYYHGTQGNVNSQPIYSDTDPNHHGGIYGRYPTPTPNGNSGFEYTGREGEGVGNNNMLTSRHYNNISTEMSSPPPYSQNSHKRQRVHSPEQSVPMPTQTQNTAPFSPLYTTNSQKFNFKSDS